MRRIVVDLSHVIEPGMPVFPGYPSPALVPWTTHEAHGYAAEAVFMVTHSGTHMDAPWHFVRRGKRIDEMEPASLVCEAAVLDCRGAGEKKRIGEVMLRRAERGCTLDSFHGAAAIIVTGFARHWEKPMYLTSYPGLTVAGARYLRKRGYRVVAVDSPNLDHPAAAGFPAHRDLLGHGIVIVENLANAESLLRHRKRRITLVALPLKIKGASGSPVRAVALVD